jgi:hypothetical protein
MRWARRAGWTNLPLAHGKGVWSWCPDAGTKSRGYEPRGDGAIKPGPRGERAISRSAIAQRRPEGGLSLWFLPRAFLLHGGHGYQQIPGLPRALSMSRASGSGTTRAPGAAGRPTRILTSHGRGRCEKGLGSSSHLSCIVALRRGRQRLDPGDDGAISTFSGSNFGQTA